MNDFTCDPIDTSAMTRIDTKEQFDELLSSLVVHKIINPISYCPEYVLDINGTKYVVPLEVVS